MNTQPPKSYSQLQQDLAVLSYFNNMRNGYFVEIGSSDGISLNNTYLLEKEFGWSGLCIEPLVEEFAKLKQNRKSICINKAIYTYNGTIEFVEMNSSMLSGSNSDMVVRNGETIKRKYNVECVKLMDVLSQNNAPKFIHYFSLDTEGSEFLILSSIDFNKYKFGLIDVEHNYEEPKRTNIKNLLLSNGYILYKNNQWDDTYILPSFFDIQENYTGIL
jgi:FkbM family methyltransferase